MTYFGRGLVYWRTIIWWKTKKQSTQALNVAIVCVQLKFLKHTFLKIYVGLVFVKLKELDTNFEIQSFSTGFILIHGNRITFIKVLGRFQLM